MTARELPEVRDERAAHAHELLLERLRALTTSDEWLAMLKMSRRFHSYSARNVLLLLAQARRDVSPVTAPGKPSLRRAAEPAQVRKGARALTVLAPITRDREEVDETTGDRTTRRVLVGFKGVRVFDEAALVAPPATPQGMPELLQGESPEHLWGRARTAGRRGRLHAARRGLRPSKRTYRLDHGHRHHPAGSEPVQRVKTLAHELAHIRLHDPAGDLTRRASRERMEVEAESVAYLVCAHAGIDTAQYTIPYVAHWSGGDMELVQTSAERVIDTARTITVALDHNLAPNPDVPRSLAEPVAIQSVRQDKSRAVVDAAREQHPSTLSPQPNNDGSLASIRRRVERDAAQLLAQLATNPDAWGADPADRDAIRRAARATPPAASPAVVTARQRLGELLHHPAAPEPSGLGPIPDLR